MYHILRLHPIRALPPLHHLTFHHISRDRKKRTDTRYFSCELFPH